MENSRRNLYAVIIAGISFVLVIGAMLTALAETGFSPPASSSATDTSIPVSTSTPAAGIVSPIPQKSSATPDDQLSEQTPTQEIKTPTKITDVATISPTTTVTTFSATEPPITTCTIPSSWITYKVQSGDTLFSIAVRYQTTVTNLQIGNCMGSSTKIITGTTIRVPNNPTITPTKTTTPTSTKVVCYSLTLSNSGNGSKPTASPLKSANCSTGMYVAGEKISLTAAPATGWTVGSWIGTDNDASTSKTNTLTMPAKNHSASVTYLAPTCYTLSLSISGTGANLIATPTNSSGCAGGSYIAGENITLTADPAPGWTVTSWIGTDNDASTSKTNTLTMPAKNHSASVVYQAICYALTLTHSGTGVNPTAAPTKSASCTAGFIAGEVITLTAAPAGGGSVTGWTGTNDDSILDTTNYWTMRSSDHTINVEYTP